MHSKLYRPTALAALAAAALFVAGCSSTTDDSSSEGESSSIAIPAFGSINGYPQIPVAVAEGYFDEEFGVEDAIVEVAPVVSGNDGVSALRTGSVDMVVTGYDPAGLVDVDDIVMLALVEASPETTRIIVAEDSDIESVEDLKGKTVASYTSTPNAILVGALTEAGLTTDDIEYIMVESDVAASTLASGSIDAWLTFDPAAANAEVAGIARVIATGEDFNHLNPIILFTTDAYLESNRDSVLATLRAMDLSTDWIVEHQSDGEVAAVVSDATGLETEVAQRSLDHRNYVMEPINESTIEWMVDMAERAYDLELTSGMPDIEGLVDNDIYNEALEG